LFVTPSPPPKLPPFSTYVIVVICVCSAVGLLLLLLALLVCYKCVGRAQKDKKTRVKVAPATKVWEGRKALTLLRLYNPCVKASIV